MGWACDMTWQCGKVVGKVNGIIRSLTVLIYPKSIWVVLLLLHFTLFIQGKWIFFGKWKDVLTNSVRSPYSLVVWLVERLRNEETRACALPPAVLVGGEKEKDENIWWLSEVRLRLRIDLFKFLILSTSTNYRAFSPSRTPWLHLPSSKDLLPAAEKLHLGLTRNPLT